MKVIFLLLLICSLLVNLAIFFPNRSYACSCAMSNSTAEELNQSSAVFQGKVLGISTKSSFFSKSSADPVEVTFAVEKVWKGVEQNKVMIRTVASDASCGYEFQKDTTYLVYAKENNGKLEVYLCSRTAELSNANDDLKSLGASKMSKDQLQKVSEKEYEGFPWVWTIAVIIVVISLSTTFIVLKIKRSGKKA